MEPSTLQLVLQFVVGPLGAAIVAVAGTLLGAASARRTAREQTRNKQLDDFNREQRVIVAKLLRLLTEFDRGHVEIMGIFEENSPDEQASNEAVKRLQTVYDRVNDAYNDIRHLCVELVILAGRGGPLEALTNDIVVAVDDTHSASVKMGMEWQTRIGFQVALDNLLSTLKDSLRPLQVRLIDIAHDDLRPSSALDKK